MTQIKNIIFDYGGVILNIDHELPVKAFYNLGLKDFGSLYSQAVQSHLFDHLETGKIDPLEFYGHIREISGLELTNEQIETAWNTIILDMPEHRIELLKKLKDTYRIFLLSNTNSIHYKLYSKMLKDLYGLTFADLFEKAYFSFQLGMKKPDREIFELVLRESRLDPHETLFIDDSIQHIKASEQAGLNAYLLSGGKDITELFNPVTFEIIESI
ncbi:MAG: HAD family hydrolase [Bacteroidales bacterium]